MNFPKNEWRAKKLSLNKEISLLRKLKNLKPLDWGSSRLVFKLENGTVAKLAIGTYALNQNRCEIKLWQSNGAYLPLAQIHYFGRFIEVMEEVKAFDASDVEYGYIDDVDEEEATEVADKLSEVLGCTADNYQLGLTKRGDLVSYDYGFRIYGQHSCHDQCGYASWAASNKRLRIYIDKAIELLRSKTPVNKIDKELGDLIKDW